VTMAKKAPEIEDRGDIRELLPKGLILLGWELLLASSGREAMKRLASHLPSVILMDMRIPHGKGFEIARSPKAHPVYGKIPILAASGYFVGLFREQCLAAGCAELIAKPFAFSELESQLADLLLAVKPNALDAP